MSPFRNISKLFVGDFLAKALNFLTFVYLARIFGAKDYGIIEFTIAASMYFLMLADAGLEIWATRQVARAQDIRILVGRILPLRILLAIICFGLLHAAIHIFRGHVLISALLSRFSLLLLVQAVNLKWVFMGQERMSKVGTGLILSQIVFSIGIFAIVQRPSEMFWIPVLRVWADAALVVYFAGLFFAQFRTAPLFSIRNALDLLKPSLVIGSSLFLGLINFNFDSILLGIMIGPAEVGFYSVAYKPVIIGLAVTATYFVGLFPALSRTFGADNAEFKKIIDRSLRLSALFAIPLGLTGTLLAKPLFNFLFGEAYLKSVPVFQILIWTAVLVILRGTFKHGLISAGYQGPELRRASIAVGLNVILNLFVIPRFGMTGAAFATLASEVVWGLLTYSCFRKYVSVVSILPALYHPIAATVLMAVVLLVFADLFWIWRLLLGGVTYAGTLLALGEKETRHLLTLFPVVAGRNLKS